VIRARPWHLQLVYGIAIHDHHPHHHRRHHQPSRHLICELLCQQVDIPRAVYNFRFFAGHILHSEEVSTQVGNDAINYTVSQPVGIAGLISPWNLPLYLLTWKIAPAIAGMPLLPPLSSCRIVRVVWLTMHLVVSWQYMCLQAIRDDIDDCLDAL
jgi:hypothetical protein